MHPSNIGIDICAFVASITQLHFKNYSFMCVGEAYIAFEIQELLFHGHWTKKPFTRSGVKNFCKTNNKGDSGHGRSTDTLFPIRSLSFCLHVFCRMEAELGKCSRLPRLVNPAQVSKHHCGAIVCILVATPVPSTTPERSSS